MSNTTPELLDLLKAGVHFGHKTSRWHPKMAPFIFGARGGVHLINLEKTREELARACEFVRALGREGKVLLFVGTKKQAAPLIKKYATEVGAPYVENRWLGGTITNWAELYKLIRKYLDLKGKQERGELGKYTKKEQLDFSKDIERMSQLVHGISTLTKLPDALFIVDIKHEETALAEANQKKIPIIALCDTNANPERVQYPIPGNDDAVKSIELVVKCIAQAYQEGKEEGKTSESSAQVNQVNQVVSVA
ncbi:30S ribosomal protein S2 [Candidatus Uhrbacteria bacterium RIFCSPLOWO2_01_FULL_47_24]|uniref:Small ribosomal subunit protein uS2 n=1 Tax=Candidatus Uhrbacteria bacterium RIFCSPLOWO2_01_FULL_47_24 TaxID=1802401 RepID=A0A1F7UQW5_9BACT|nr:MAG: 30S ribosomal protein S2 [Candidatus Uhrbacteria bacterium RIFCSPHIGHO2_01_FULL_47_11]OGL67902.1 MAG: 30S ribosomal protein S2 [Candidatus Uhrbacteria bacterium RIFCSPHIGHO2_02_FULL_46_47]OGL75325.1 MAG: 30S ribosomal protein S2 [Candidatus Uhrbacteria bacterium RIFCSPHIGHO2_12_FULL_47_11]OGL80088.1 MAG: 30S ribosomal protein S2 [Candidatus Uhrbacteria bacterium RIFCSPLOWO2_01_FULL_47_24]OGL84874.1 MAG: 30S ribosomal protein S2 [Candidatus Uhrbacteria bacterium RIFCSPLOWO2_02_FULL_46_25